MQCAATTYEKFISDGRPASDFVSLDNTYARYGIAVQWHIAIANHNSTSTDEMDLQIGDEIAYIAKPINVGKGINKRTKKEGFYPLHKTKQLIKTANFSAFEKV